MISADAMEQAIFCLRFFLSITIDKWFSFYVFPLLNDGMSYVPMVGGS